MALQHAIMTALIEDDLSGYELARAFDASLGLFWQASHQQIYQELRKMTQRRLLRRREVGQQGRPDKIVYGLTAAGRRALDAWVFEASRTRDTKDDLLVKLYNLSAANIDHLREEITRRRAEMMQRLFLYERIRRRHYPHAGELELRRKGVYLALLAGIRHGEQFLAWCDEALKLLAEAVGADLPAVPHGGGDPSIA